MTDQKELREKIAVIIGEDKYRDSFYGEFVTEADRAYCRKTADLIMSLIQSACWLKGNHVPTYEVRPYMKKWVCSKCGALITFEQDESDDVKIQTVLTHVETHADALKPCKEWE